jgi:hypothetical protein
MPPVVGVYFAAARSGIGGAARIRFVERHYDQTIGLIGW